MTQKRPARPSAGFTLIEVMVTIAIAAILLMVAAPSFTKFQRNSQLTAAANTLLAALTSARAEAMKQQYNAFVRPSDSVNWAQGWTAYVDVDWSKTYTAGDLLVVAPTLALPTPITATGAMSDANGPYVMFTGAGYLGDSTTQQPLAPSNLSGVAITLSNGTESRLILMQTSGRMRVCNPASDTTCTATNVF